MDTAPTEIYALSLHDALPISYRALDPAPPKTTVPVPASVCAAVTKNSSPNVLPLAAPRLAVPLSVKPPATLANASLPLMFSAAPRVTTDQHTPAPPAPTPPPPLSPLQPHI